MKQIKRTQVIKFTHNNRAYITKYHKRYYLDECYQCEPFEYQGLKIHGIITIFNTLCMYVHINDNCDTAIAILVPIE